MFYLFIFYSEWWAADASLARQSILFAHSLRVWRFIDPFVLCFVCNIIVQPKNGFKKKVIWSKKNWQAFCSRVRCTYVSKSFSHPVLVNWQNPGRPLAGILPWIWAIWPQVDDSEPADAESNTSGSPSSPRCHLLILFLYIFYNNHLRFLYLLLWLVWYQGPTNFYVPFHFTTTAVFF